MFPHTGFWFFNTSTTVQLLYCSPNQHPNPFKEILKTNFILKEFNKSIEFIAGA
jgi:hypothetical protein